MDVIISKHGRASDLQNCTVDRTDDPLTQGGVRSRMLIVHMSSLHIEKHNIVQFIIFKLEY